MRITGANTVYQGRLLARSKATGANQRQPIRVFSSFSNDELAFMNLRGLESIDIQDGCPNRCIACARDARRFRPRNAMSPEKLNALSAKITELRMKGACDLFPAIQGLGYLYDYGGWTFNRTNRRYEKQVVPFDLALFHGSDPVNYHARDERGEEWTIYEVADLLHREHGVEMVITTAGWRAGGFRMQAMERLVARMKDDKSFKIALSYSIKLLGKAVRKEHDAFMQEVLGDAVSAMLGSENGVAIYNRYAEAHADAYIRSSRYVQRLVDNMRMLKGVDVKYVVDYIDSKNKLTVPYRRYRYLFSKEMISRVVAYAHEQSGVGTIEQRDQPMTALGRGVRDFGVVGCGEHYSEDHVLRSTEQQYEPRKDPHPFDINFVREERSRVSRLGWQKHKDTIFDLYAFYVHLNSQGTVSIMYGSSAHDLRNIAVSKEYFLRRAVHHEGLSSGDDDHARMAKYLHLLAGLVGKNVFA